MRQFLRIRNWERFQHYKDRSPPWIKLHRELLTSETWVSTDDASRVLAIALMLLAAATDNKIPANKQYIRRAAYLNSDPDWGPLVDAQFIEIVEEDEHALVDASKALASGTKCSSEERREEKSREETESGSPVFDQIRKLYPKRSGSHRWSDAQSAFRARLREGHTAEEILAGVSRYAQFVRASGNEGSSFVQQAATFLGTNRGFLEPWIFEQKRNGTNGHQLP